jgi:ATP-dependent protease Clp ATPase subunit
MRIRALRCSFCGKNDAEVAKLVAGPRVFPGLGPRVFICDACVATSARLMEAPVDEHRSPGRRRGLIRRFVDWIAVGLGRSEFRAVSG